MTVLGFLLLKEVTYLGKWNYLMLKNFASRAPKCAQFTKKTTQKCLLPNGLGVATKSPAMSDSTLPHNLSLLAMYLPAMACQHFSNNCLTLPKAILVATKLPNWSLLATMWQCGCIIAMKLLALVIAGNYVAM